MLFSAQASISPLSLVFLVFNFLVLNLSHPKSVKSKDRFGTIVSPQEAKKRRRSRGSRRRKKKTHFPGPPPALQEEVVRHALPSFLGQLALRAQGLKNLEQQRLGSPFLPLLLALDDLCSCV